MVMSRPDLVLLAGWGMPARIWQPVAEQLQDHFTVHCRDLLLEGHDCSLANLAARVAATVPAQAIWCGWSLGGLVARYWASQQPMTQVLTVAHNPCFVQQPDYVTAMPAMIWSAFVQDFQHQPQATWKRFLALQSQGSTSGKTERRLLAAYETLPLCTDQLSKALTLLAVDSRAWSISCPQSALLMEHDALVPISLAASLPQTEVTIWPQACHSQFISQPQFLVDWLLRVIHPQQPRSHTP